MRCTDNEGRVSSYGYDDGNRLTSATDQTNPAIPGGFTVGRGHDGVSNLTSLTYGGDTYTYGYNERDDLTSLILPAGTVNLSYDDARNRKDVTTPDSANRHYTYDDANRITGVINTTASGTQDFTYTHDGNGNILTENSTSYGYDPLNRLDSWTNDGVTTTYQYDDAGNLTRRSRGPSPSMLLNGGFEAYTEGIPHDDFANWDEWSNSSGFTLEADPVNYHEGATATRFTNTDTTSDAELVSDYIEVDENQRYDCYSWWKKLSGMTLVGFGIQCFDQNKNPLLINGVFTANFEGQGGDIPTTWTELGGTIYRSSEPAQWPLFAPGTKYIRIVCSYHDWVGSAVLDEEKGWGQVLQSSICC